MASRVCSLLYRWFLSSQTCSSCANSGTMRNVRQPRSFLHLSTSPKMWSPKYSTSFPFAPINLENTSHEPDKRENTKRDLSNVEAVTDRSSPKVYLSLTPRINLPFSDWSCVHAQLERTRRLKTNILPVSSGTPPCSCEKGIPNKHDYRCA